MRSTLRCNAMATPASVHCMSRQLVFGDLSCTGLRRKVWHPRHHCLVTIHIVSHWIVRSSWNFWIWILRSYGFGPVQQPPGESLSESLDSGIASALFPLVSCRCCTLCSICTQLHNRSIVNLSSFWIHASIFFATFEPLWNKKPLSPYKTVTPPIVVFSPTDNSGAQLSSRCAESEVNMTKKLLPVRDTLRPCRLSRLQS